MMHQVVVVCYCMTYSLQKDKMCQYVRAPSNNLTNKQSMNKWGSMFYVVYKSDYTSEETKLPFYLV